MAEWQFPPGGGRDRTGQRSWQGAISSGGHMRRLLVIAGMLLAGCASVEPGRSANRQFHLGAVSVRVPTTSGNVSAVSVKTLGIGWDNGLYLGWRSGAWVTADPSKCQLLIIIRSAAEAANAIKIIKSLEGQEPCIVDFTNSLRG